MRADRRIASASALPGVEREHPLEQPMSVTRTQQRRRIISRFYDAAFETQLVQRSDCRAGPASIDFGVDRRYF